MISGGVLKFNNREYFFGVFEEAGSAAATHKAYACAFMCVCACLVMYFRPCTSICGFLWHHHGKEVAPAHSALGGDRGAKGDVTAMSAPCMCLFAPENETPVSLRPPGHV